MSSADQEALETGLPLALCYWLMNTHPPKKRRPHISVHFACCNVYAYVYLNAAKTAYAGHCPRCAAKVTVKAVPGATNTRFWSAG